MKLGLFVGQFLNFFGKKMLCKSWWRNGHVFSKFGKRQAKQHVQYREKLKASQLTHWRQLTMQCIQYHILAIVLLGQIPWHAEKQNVAFNHFGLCFWNVFNVPFLPLANMFSSNDSQQFKCHAKPPEAEKPSAPWGLTLASLKPPYRLPVQGQAGWGFPPLQGCLYNAVVTLQLPTQSWLYDPTNANLCYLSFQYHDFIPYANLCQSLNLICTSTYQGLDSGRPDSYPAVYKKNTGCLTLWHFCFILFFKKNLQSCGFESFLLFCFLKKNLKNPLLMVLNHLFVSVK